MKVMSRKKPKSSSTGNLRTALKGIASVSLGLLLAVIVFMALPFLQMVADMNKKEYEVTEVTTTEDEPPPPELEQPEPEEPEPEETPPPPPQDFSFDQIADSFDLGSGGAGNAPFVQSALMDALNKRAGSAMSLGGSVKKPRPIKSVPPRLPTALKSANIAGTV